MKFFFLLFKGSNKMVWLIIILGAVFIAIGGMIGTFGWEKLNLNHQKQTINKAVFREWESNDKMIDKAIDLLLT